jgi:soluble lytic murein transglycosylase-like protein
MEVEQIEFDGSFAVLTLEGGARISTPKDRIARFDEIAPPPKAVQAALTTVSGDGRWRIEAGQYADVIESAARTHGLDPALLAAMATVESSFDPSAVSPKGAAGLLQLMPATARRFGVADVFDASQNVDGGARYLSWLMKRFDGRTDLALAGYNAGEGAVDRHNGIPPYRETREYVRRVLRGAGRTSDLAP